MNTKETILAIQNNESRTLMKALYKHALPPIITYVKQKRGSKSDAEDCFQEAVLVLVKKVKENTYDQEYEVHNFLFVVARNIWFTKLKRMSLAPMIDLGETEWEDDAQNSIQELISEEKKNAFEILLASAGERCRDLLKLIIFENKKLKEVAEIMQFSSEEVVKTNHYRCKQKLKETLKGNLQLAEILN